jgi:hypothetical protein
MVSNTRILAAHFQGPSSRKRVSAYFTAVPNLTRIGPKREGNQHSQYLACLSGLGNASVVVAEDGLFGPRTPVLKSCAPGDRKIEFRFRL